MKNKTSVLKIILDQVFVSTSYEQALEIVKARLNESKINDRDKRLILITAKQCETLPKLQQYITNSYFKFSGMSVGRR